MTATSIAGNGSLRDAGRPMAMAIRGEKDAEFRHPEADENHLRRRPHRRPDIDVGGKEKVAEQDDCRLAEGQKGRKAIGQDQQQMRERLADMVGHALGRRLKNMATAREQQIDREAVPVERHRHGDENREPEPPGCGRRDDRAKGAQSES
jgi:hypothetical protein